MMLCTCRRAQPGERSPCQVRVCQGGLAWGHSQFPRGRGEERRGLGGPFFFPLIFTVISNVKAYWERLK